MKSLKGGCIGKNGPERGINYELERTLAAVLHAQQNCLNISTTTVSNIRPILVTTSYGIDQFSFILITIWPFSKVQ